MPTVKVKYSCQVHQTSGPYYKGNDDEYTIDRQYPMQYDIPSLDEVEYSYLDSLLTAVQASRTL